MPYTTTTTQKQLEGEVVSTKEDKTIRVVVKTLKMHPKYRKQYWATKRYAAHDEKGEAAVGDTVLIEACRPLSKSKRNRLVKIVKRAE